MLSVGELTELLGAEDHRMDVVAWLRGLGLERYAPVFRDNDIDGDLLRETDRLVRQVEAIPHCKRSISRKASKPPSEDSRPPSKRATTALPCTGDRPGRNGVASTMAGAAPVARVKLGDEANGFIAEAVVSSSTDAAEWLRANAVRRYAASEFAKLFPLDGEPMRELGGWPSRRLNRGYQ